MILEKTGIPGLDKMLKGGIKPNTSIILKGTPGTGKTILALQFIFEGAKQGQPGVFITAEEELDNLREYAKDLGMNIEEYEKKKLIYLIKQPIQLKKLISFATPLELISKGKVKRVVIDSLTLFKYSTEDEMAYRKEILNLIENMKNVLFIATAEEREENINKITTSAEDSLFDGIIRLIKVRKGNNFERCIFVPKMRGQDHLLDIYPFIIKKSGIEVYTEQIPFSLIESSFKEKK